MVTTVAERLDIKLQIERENLAIKYEQYIAPLSGAAWLHKAAHYGHKEMQIQGLWNPDIRNELMAVALKATYPTTKAGFMDILDHCRTLARERMDASEPQPIDPNRPRVVRCYRVSHPKAHYYRLHSSQNPGEFIANTPEMITALEALLPQVIVVGKVLDVPLQITWSTNREDHDEAYDKPYRQVVIVGKPELSEEDILDLTDLAAEIGIDTLAEVPDYTLDVMTLDSLHMRGWLDFVRNGKGGKTQYRIPAKTAEKAGVDMENMQVKLQQILGDWRYDSGMPRTPGMMETEHTLSGILGDSISKFFVNGGTYDEAIAKMKAHFDPLVAAHKATLAAKPPSALDEFIPRDENNEPAGLDGDPTQPKRGMGDPKAKIVEIAPESGSQNATPRTGETFGKLWADVDKVFKSRGFKMAAWRNANDFKAFEVGKTDDQIVADANAWIDNVIVTTKADIKQHTETKSPEAIAPTQEATPSNDDAISGEIVNETPKSIENKPSGNEPSKALTISDKKVSLYQPNPYWLTSPQWQVSPFEMAKFVAESRLFKNADSPAKALALIFKGIEIGVGPMAALEHLNIIDGKPPTCDGALMLALLRKAGISVEFIERTDKICRLKMTRPDNGDFIIQQFTFDEAQKAGLTGKGNWKYARAMLTWRAVSEAAKLIASDLMIMVGIPMYTHEEINPDAVLNEDGTLAA